MITSLMGASGDTYHAVNRDGSAAMCRSNLTPRQFPVRVSSGFSEKTEFRTAAKHIPGESFNRSCSRYRVTCFACQNKLKKITSEAFDAATAEDPSHTDQTVTPAEIGARTATQKLARLQAARPAHECTLSRRGIDCMCADAAELDIETDQDDSDENEPVEFRQTRLYDREASQAMFVLGTVSSGRGVAFCYENDGVTESYRVVTRTALRNLDRYIALCRHYYTHVDLCPRCALDAQRVAQRDELIRQANEATPDPVAVSADDELIEKLRHVVDSYATADPERWAIIATMFSGRHNIPPTTTGLTYGDLSALLALVTRPKRLELAPLTDAARAGNVLGSGFGMMVERREDGTGNRVLPVTAEDTHYLETRR